MGASCYSVWHQAFSKNLPRDCLAMPQGVPLMVHINLHCQRVLEDGHLSGLQVQMLVLWILAAIGWTEKSDFCTESQILLKITYLEFRCEILIANIKLKFISNFIIHISKLAYIKYNELSCVLGNVSV